MKKVTIIIFSIIIIFGIFLFRSKNYSIDYKVSNINIKESYDKAEKSYTFVIKDQQNVFDFKINSKYIHKKKLITKIKTKDTSGEKCYEFQMKKLSMFSVCHENDLYRNQKSNKEAKFMSNQTYQKIEIQNLNNKNYLLWNYSEMIYLSSKKNLSKKLFNKDIYNLKLNYQYQNYLIIPNYNQDYKIDKMYIIDSQNFKVDSISMRYDLYFDSFFLGHYKNNIYLYDLKSEKEYYISLAKKELYQTGYQVLKNGKWEKISNQKLKNNKVKFSYKQNFNYYLDNKKLYLEYEGCQTKYLLTSRIVDKIIAFYKEEVYYIADDTLYCFNLYTGEKALLKYNEWTFNKENMIFIFEPK